MLNTTINKEGNILMSEFKDSKNRLHFIKHSIADCSDKNELENSISEELYKIFANNKKVSV